MARRRRGHAHLRRPAADADLWVDALFGIGLTRAPDGAVAGDDRAINAARLPVLALDVPCGLDAGSRRRAGAAVRATHTA